MDTNKAVTYHEITPENATTAKLNPLLDLSQFVFAPVTPEQAKTPAHNLSGWEAHIKPPQSIILYATKADHPEEPVGLFFATPRTHPEVGTELLHLWIAVIHPNSRGLGIFPSLLTRLKDHARKCGYKQMTVCTYPARFETMYRILNQHGWELLAWIGEKVLMRIDL